MNRILETNWTVQTYGIMETRGQRGAKLGELEIREQYTLQQKRYTGTRE